MVRPFKTVEHISKIKPYKLIPNESLVLDSMGNNVYKLDWNESVQSPPNRVKDAIFKFVTNGKLNWYPDIECKDLKNKLSNYLDLPSLRRHPQDD